MHKKQWYLDLSLKLSLKTSSPKPLWNIYLKEQHNDTSHWMLVYIMLTCLLCSFRLKDKESLCLNYDNEDKCQSMFGYVVPLLKLWVLNKNQSDHCGHKGLKETGNALCFHDECWHIIKGWRQSLVKVNQKSESNCKIISSSCVTSTCLHISFTKSRLYQECLNAVC